MPAADEPGSPIHGTETGTDTLIRNEVSLDKGWNAILWNDPVNVTEYVTATLMHVLRISAEKAQQLMLTAHLEGKAVVFSGAKEKAEEVVTKLHAAVLNATMERV